LRHNILLPAKIRLLDQSARAAVCAAPHKENRDGLYAPAGWLLVGCGRLASLTKTIPVKSNEQGCVVDRTDQGARAL
jgi:hypothetical protein